MVAIVDYYAGIMRIESGTGDGWDPAKRKTELNVGRREGEGITAYVAATKQPYTTGDVTTDRHYRAMFPETRSELALPITDPHGRLRGVLNVESDKPHAFTQEHVEQLRPLAALCDVALQLQLERRRQDALIRIGLTLAGPPDENALLQEVMGVTYEMLEYQACSIFVWNEEEAGYVLRATRGALEAMVGSVVYHPGEGLTGWVAEHCDPVRITSPHNDPRWSGRHLEIPAEDISAFLAVPIPGRDRPLGVIRVIRHRQENPYIDNSFTERDEKVLAALAAVVGAGLEGAGSVRKLLRAERMATWGEMSARSSHMIGNRVFAVNGDLNELRYLVSRPELDRAKLKEISDSLSLNVNRLEEILADYRDFVMATRVNLGPVDINELVRSTLEETFPKRSEMSVKTELANDLPQTMADAEKLRRVMAELVENALHFQSSGTFRVTTSLAKPAEWPKGRRPRGKREYIRIVFQDEGPGVPEAEKASIFSPFKTSRVRGMGLGLSIAKGIVEAHEGLVFEDGVPGKGARFVILLPVSPVAERKVPSE